MINSIARVVRVERFHHPRHTHTIIPERPNATDPQPFRGKITFKHVAFGYESGVYGESFSECGSRRHASGAKRCETLQAKQMPPGHSPQG